MPVVSCPSCRGELDLDAADLGYRVECPLCRGTFIAEGNKPAAPPASRAPDPVGNEQVVHCRHCDGKVSVLAADLGYEMECPLCGRGFVARGEREGGWRPRHDDRDDRRSRFDDDEWDDDRDLIEFAKRECSAAGTGLQVVGWLGGIFSLILLPIQIFAAIDDGTEAWAIPLFVGLFLFQAVMSILQIVGGRHMKQAKSWGLCLTACISALLSGCIGLVFGIMGIVKLSNQRVKRGFQLNNPNYDPDM